MTKPYILNGAEDTPEGEVTALLRQLQGGGGDGERLFDSVLTQLTKKAAVVLRDFPALRHRVEPHDLVGQFYERLLTQLSGFDIKSRATFFALAAKHFRWILLDMLKAGERALVPETGDQVPSTETGPATRVARTADVEAIFRHVEEKLGEQDRMILDMRIMLGMTYQQIAEELGMPLQTVHHRFNKTLGNLRERFS